MYCQIAFEEINPFPMKHIEHKRQIHSAIVKVGNLIILIKFCLNKKQVGTLPNNFIIFL